MRTEDLLHHVAIEDEIDVLIGSRAVGTGVDGLQHWANTLIIASAPWTAAAYKQLVGRLVRQDQKKQMEVVFPLTYAEVGDTEWSWCQSRPNRIRYKKSMPMQRWTVLFRPVS